MFKSQNKLAIAFHFKDHILEDFTSGVVSKFQCRLSKESYCHERVKHLNVKVEEHIRIS